MAKKIFLGYGQNNLGLAQTIAQNLSQQGINITSPMTINQGEHIVNRNTLIDEFNVAEMSVILLSGQQLLKTEENEMLQHTLSTYKPSIIVNLEETGIQVNAMHLNLEDSSLKRLRDTVVDATNEYRQNMVQGLLTQNIEVVSPLSITTPQFPTLPSERADAIVQNLPYALPKGFVETIDTDSALEVAGWFPEKLQLDKSTPISIDLIDLLKFAKESPTEDVSGQTEYQFLPLERGQQLSIVPLLTNASIFPKLADVQWTEDFQPVRFLVKPHSSSAPVEGYIKLSAGPIVLGVMRFFSRVGSATSKTKEPMPEVMRKYKKVFLSYSHNDQTIVKMMDKLYEQFPKLKTLVDYREFKAGDDWWEKAKVKIEEANALQLFWSNHSAKSEAVEKEWRYAYDLPRDIIPVIFGEPRPDVPDELNHIIFEDIDRFIEHF